MFRASDGKTRIDSGNISVITNPKMQQAIVLDHVSKEARVLLMPPAPPQLAALPLGAAAPALQLPSQPAMQHLDLGKSLIDGHEVDGKRYIVPPPAPPQLPQMPQSPQAPQKPQMPTTVEVWTSTKLGLPVLTKVTGPFGQQICSCKPAQTGEPHPGLFQIPPGYKSPMPSATVR